MKRRRLLAVALVSFVPATTPFIPTSADLAGRLPSRLEIYLTTVVRLTQSERRRLMDGAAITKLLDADAGREVAVLGAVWIEAPIRRYVEAVKDIESLERGGGFKVTRRISMPPRLEDFADMRLPEGDVEDLRTCRVGDCQVQLDENQLETFRSEVDWKAPGAGAAASAVMRTLAHAYVTGYLASGDARLAVYRDKSEPIVMAEELRGIVDAMPSLSADMPDVRRYLLNYPHATLPNSTSFLYWQDTQFGLKPTIRISHLVIREGPDDTVVASKMLYASHYFWAALELRVLVPDPSRGSGFWFLTVSRSRADGLSGFAGPFVRWRVRRAVQEGALTALHSTKRRLEGTR